MSQSSSNVKHEGRFRRPAVLSIGSNAGERESTVLAAASVIASRGGVNRPKLSSLYETEPVGAGYSRQFINAVMTFETSLDPRSLLGLCMELEIDAGRDPEDRSGDRTLDIDIILMGSLKIDTAGLTVPHPRFRERRFVLLPLAEIEPELPLPPDGKTAARAALESSLSAGVFMISARGRTPKYTEYR
jgi:2-amino-4-hydroxy-6-hydroxymethyldihydropteridine diphosphokinase